MFEDPFGIVGTTIDGKYQVLTVIGEGGFGVVYRGVHLTLEQPIAVKCLRVPPHFNAQARQVFFDRFRAEGKHLARIGHHPAIVRVYDFGVVASNGAQAIPYLVLEWLAGRDLQQLMAERQALGLPPFSEPEAVSLLRPAIDAIRLAHAQGIVHRDLKPANLFLSETSEGRALKVLDFGIAKAVHEGHRVSELSTQTLRGFGSFSPLYGAPEQFRPDRYGSTGPWTDVHALGLVLTELVAGRRAYGSADPADLVQAATSPVRPTPRRLGANVSEQLEQLCAKALALMPTDRFGDAGETLRALDQLSCVGAEGVRASAARSATVEAAPAAIAPEAQPTGAFIAGQGLGLERSAQPGADAAPVVEPTRAQAPVHRTIPDGPGGVVPTRAQGPNPMGGLTEKAEPALAAWGQRGSEPTVPAAPMGPGDSTARRARRRWLLATGLGVLLLAGAVTLLAIWPSSPLARGISAGRGASSDGAAREPSVAITADFLREHDWWVTFHFNEPVDGVEYQRSGDAPFVDVPVAAWEAYEGAGRRRAVIRTDLQGRMTLRVRYRPHATPTIVRGPFEVIFDEREQAVASCKENIRTFPTWPIFRRESGRLVCSFAVVVQYKYGLRAIRFGLDRDLPDRALHFTPRLAREIDKGDETEVTLPEGTRSVVVELEFLDGATQRKSFPVRL